MARGKKAENALTPEERLAQALVPDWEQPYKVPGNWCWTRLRSLVETSKEKTENFSVPDVKYVGLEHIEKDTGIIGHSSTAEVKSLKNIFHPGQILYGKLRPYLNKHDIADFDGVCSTDILVFDVRPTALAEYVNFYLNQKDFIEYAVANSKGINLPRVSENVVLEAFCPLPPLAEQQCIVDRIESLFGKLDEAKEKAQAVLDSFETRKAAILHKAFAGELTAKWREEHGVGMESWEEKTLNSMCKSIFDGDHMPPPKAEFGIPFLVISNVNTGHLSFEKTRFVPEDYYHSLSNTRKPQQGDVLYTLVGSYGIPVIVDSDNAFCFQRHMALLKPESVDSYFLWYLLQSQNAYLKATEIATGTAQLTVPIKGLRAITFMIPCLDEQTEIVRILDSLFAKEQQAKEAAEAVLEQIDLLKKSILARAFRGELGTNDPAEESAVGLVKSVLF